MWRTVWDAPTTVEKTILWYRAFHEAGRIRSADDLRDYLAAATQRKLIWTQT
jgi:CDP-glucose 4,6-dehydratase